MPILGRLVGRPPALVGHRKILDEVPLATVMLEVPLDLHISPLVALAGRDGRLHADLMTERAKERLELGDGPVMACAEAAID